MNRKPLRSESEDVPPPLDDAFPQGSTKGQRISSTPDVNVPEVLEGKFSKGGKELQKTYARVFGGISKLPFIRSDATWNDSEFDSLAEATLDLCNKIKALRIILRILGWAEAPFLMIEKVQKMLDQSAAIAERKAKKEAQAQEA